MLLYISNKNGSYEEIANLAQNALTCWQKDRDYDAQRIALYLLQSSEKIASALMSRVTTELKLYNDEAVESLVNSNLDLLEACGELKAPTTELSDTLWDILGSTENSLRAEQVSHILCLLLPLFNTTPLKSGIWWPAIVACIQRTTDKRHVSAALRAWLSCAVLKTGTEDTRAAVAEDGAKYFGLLEPHISEASKIALQIMESTFDKLEKPVKNEFMEYDPQNKASKECWSRYISLVEVLGVDTSLHQTTGSLPDFAALLGEKSLIPNRWMIALINVGLCVSNTETIRVLVMELIMSLDKSQMNALVEFPDFVSQVVFPRILQTPNFVVIYSTCIHADHFERFSHNILSAYLNHSNASLEKFLRGLFLYFMEHAHCFEVPRALFVQAMIDELPAQSVPEDILNMLLVAAEATNVTYNSKAMADLYLEQVHKLLGKIGNSSKIAMKDSQRMEAIMEQSTISLLDTGAFTRDEFVHLKSHGISFSGTQQFEKFGLLGGNPSTLNESTLYLQASILDSCEYLAVEKIAKMLDYELNNPKAMNAKDRARLSESVELAFELVPHVYFGLCETAFAAFSATPTRLAALRAFMRSKPHNVPLEDIEVLWTHLKEATLRFIDRELHHEFIDLLTTPGVVSEPPVDICIELVALSSRRRNLLTPLSVGLFRFAHVSPCQPWVHVVMARIFAFMKSQEYTDRFEEIIAHRFGIYEEKWGRPESHARALAAYYLRTVTDKDCGDAAMTDTMEQAQLDTQITGSLDNPEAHLRVLYYQILILIQGYSSHDLATGVINTITKSLEMEANPPVRMHAEWLVGLLASTHIGHLGGDFKAFVLSKIKELDVSLGTPPRVLGSLIRISILLYYMEFTKSPGEAEDIGKSLVEHLLPLATSNKAVLRHRAISTLYIINERGMTPDYLRPIINTCAKINTAAIMGSSYQNESYLWDLTDTRLGPVCGGVSSAVFDRYMPQTLMENDFNDIKSLISPAVNETDFDDIIGPCWSPEKIIRPERSELSMPELIEVRERVVADAVQQGLLAEFSSSMQTKSGNFDGSNRARRTELVVVATLCDKPVNLGAICRLSDALGAKSMTIRDSKVLADQHFKSTALTAEKWIPIEEVSEQNLSEYLRKKKSEGYSLVGIEQTDTSKTLGPNLQFPEKTVLMMGHEKQGIPAELLGLLDSCIEIEQLGYVRSMNIQTATAVVVHAYNHQHQKGFHKLDYAE